MILLIMYALTMIFMRNVKAILISAFALAFFCFGNNARAITVWSVSPDSIGACTVGDPFCSTVQAAISAATGGDTINVAAATYNECLLIDKALNIVGTGGAKPAITGGIQITGGSPWSGLVLNNLEIRGDCPGNTKDAVIDLNPGPAVSDFEIRNCILDGEGDADRMAFYGSGKYGGDWTWDGNEIRGFRYWYLIDNTSSVAPGDVVNALGVVVFTNNYVHDCYGSIAFRGKPSSKTASVLVANNTFSEFPSSAASQCWAAIEVNVAVSMTAYGNAINGVPEVSWGGEGQALQIWDVDSIDVHDNDFSNNFQGIFFFGGSAGGTYGGPYVIPSGSMYRNSFVNDADYGIGVEATATGGPLDAAENWWGDASGPAPTGSGAAISGNAVFGPWLTDAAMTAYSDEKALTSFVFGSPSVAGAVDEVAKTVTVAVPNGTDVSALAPAVGISPAASVSPVSGAVNDFSAPVTYIVTAADGTTQPYTVTVTIVEAGQTVPDESGSATVTTATPEVVVTSSTQPLDVTVSSGTASASVDFSALLSGGTVVVPQTTFTTVDAANTRVSLPAGTSVTSDDPVWDGTMIAPSATTAVSLPSIPGKVAVLQAAIETGLSSSQIFFDKGVRILFPGQAGTNVGWVRTGAPFTEITTACTDDTQVTGDALPVGGDCKIDVGPDLVIWTRHFTTFAAYSSVPALSPSRRSDAAAEVTVIRPNGGEVFMPGSVQEILWQNNIEGTQKMRLALLVDIGLSFVTEVAAEEYNDGVYLWTVPAVVQSIPARFRVEALGFDGTVLSSDESDSIFTISASSVSAGSSGASTPATESVPVAPPSGSDAEAVLITTPSPGLSGDYFPSVVLGATTSIDIDKDLSELVTERNCAESTLVKIEGRDNTAVYYCGRDGKRYVFPNERVFFSWFDDFSLVMSISAEGMAAIPIGGNITYRPGKRMVKIQTDPRVYAVARGGVLRWVASEASAIELYGIDWMQKIDDVPDSFFADYSLGEPIGEPPEETPMESEQPATASEAREETPPMAMEATCTAEEEFVDFMELGSSNVQVRPLQRLLQCLGHFPQDVEPSGYFGPVTRQAVIEFQTERGLDQLGVVGPQTRSALNDYR